MTAFEQFDIFEQQVSASLAAIAPARRPDYLDEVLAVTARTPQRARWRLVGTWLPIDSMFPVARAGRTALRTVVLFAIVALLVVAATALIIAGARRHDLLPVGPAANGSLVYPTGGDLFIRDGVGAGASARPFVVGPARQFDPFLSPDGEVLAYVEAGDGGDNLWAIDVAGSAPRRLLPDPIGSGWSQWSWALDSEHLLVTGVFGGVRRLYDVRADGSGARELRFDGLIPWEAFWSPVDPGTFLLRAQEASGLGLMDLYLVNADGGNRRPLGLPGQSAYGPDYTLSGAVWAPDGRTIAYNAIELDPGTLITSYRIHLVSPDGTHDRALPGPAEPRINEAWPMYSPDGTQILAQHFIFPSVANAGDGAGWIAVLPADGSAPGRDIGVRISDVGNPDVWKDWSPDGKSVMEMVGATLKAYMVDPVTGASTELPWADDLPAWQRRAP